MKWTKRDQLVAELVGLHHQDPESAHKEAEEALLDFIEHLLEDPITDIRNAFAKVPKWYA